MIRNSALAPDGIPGNDDTGTMSAWLLFAMMGLYPDCPGNLDYQICAPVFDEVTINLPDNQEFMIKQDIKSDDFIIKNITLNGKPHNKYTLNHKKIINGGVLEIK